MSVNKQETIKNVINVHETTATMRQVMKIQAMAKEAQVVAYSAGVNFVSPILFGVNLPITKEDAGRHIKELKTILDSFKNPDTFYTPFNDFGCKEAV
jgi:hypothetical protein|tara:strand:+ start:1142 stop:1432 length:291 start_codon:yes stop_codon:yes gene_type:complete